MSSEKISIQCRSCGVEGDKYPWYVWDRLPAWKQFMLGIIYDLPGAWVVLGGRYKCPECGARQVV